MKKNLLLFLLSSSLSNAQVFSENFNGGVLPTGWTVSNANTSFNWGVGSQNSFANFSSGNAFFLMIIMRGREVLIPTQD
ncbi:hypothetical protein ACFOEQ_16155 [Chryseobacterium arachidis]|uniref:hypothetical protein n=1 Tax=Chryseobacterium arachidis TaxID=1416778 RepID=UPI00360BC87D